MKKSLLVLLSIALLVPFAASGAAQHDSSGKSQVSAAPATPSISVSQLLDFSRWFAAKDKPPSSGCGANFCTQAQRTQCAQTCRHFPFVGLECCTDTCTSFCNCGSVPTGC